jgi:Exopolyphosphatase-related proteins
MTNPTNPEQSARQVAERIRSGSNFVITSHRNPDGDALGSAIALQKIIRKMGKTATVQVRDN